MTNSKKEKTEENSHYGMISLVGAGPGDPELLTLKAYRLIQNADVIFYDRLVSEPIMAMANSEAELIYVGKKRDQHCVPQDQINLSLIEWAKTGVDVVRLKGGDPFIFGRGGEELEEIVEEGISYQVVPGVTAASGCASYSGIPLTHRDYAQSVQFVTGHLKRDGEELDWSSLARVNHTLVFYMGLTQCEEIVANLMSHGLPETTSCAIVEKGTTPEQRVLTCQLVDLVKTSFQVESPSLIIVGRVTELHHKLKWR
ncbi:uroporphyrinogen-III C-methyltransferase [Vibrio sp. SS-MA-C1-2]|uniref:uroporphyrinogen-III C-methyltransferase n=1 Tax=Vibrio sp. SS-MA-C1-2 TaxID=2908646 RepID=UPI001F47D388|nr:uroporphyrinogen-III C-methyltransferase [Vibrio sp. SS-MA-C1-2]UJF17178.1 uroporphyrinogen-III C-methyltransferase [Vibrio sp. SS-MA-C1-2]